MFDQTFPWYFLLFDSYLIMSACLLYPQMMHFQRRRLHRVPSHISQCLHNSYVAPSSNVSTSLSRLAPGGSRFSDKFNFAVGMMGVGGDVVGGKW